jgi:hypothetical protein
MTISFWRLVPGCWRMGRGDHGTSYEEIKMDDKCEKCGCGRPLDPWVTGMNATLRDGPTEITYRCKCSHVRKIPWAEATEGLRGRAYLAELSRDAANEVSMREG